MITGRFFRSDCVEIAFKEGINAVIQPGGSINDNYQLTIVMKNNMAMVLQILDILNIKLYIYGFF